MERQGDEIHITTEEARGGSTPHVVRYILVISLLLAIVMLSAIWITGAMTGAQHQPDNATANDAARSDPVR